MDGTDSFKVDNVDPFTIPSVCWCVDEINVRRKINKGEFVLFVIANFIFIIPEEFWTLGRCENSFSTVNYGSKETCAE